MARRLVIAIDCDDVLVPTAKQTVDWYNAKFGTSLKLDDFYNTATIETWGTDDDQVAIERVNEYLMSDEHAELPPFVDAPHAIKALFDAGHEIHVVTGRFHWLEPVTKKLLDTHFNGYITSIEHTNFYASAADDMKKRSKGEVCRAINADVLIDDYIAHGESVIREAGLREVIVFGDYPWNQNETLSPGMVRCPDWPSTLRELERIANEESKGA